VGPILQVHLEVRVGRNPRGISSGEVDLGHPRSYPRLEGTITLAANAVYNTYEEIYLLRMVPPTASACTASQTAAFLGVISFLSWENSSDNMHGMKEVPMTERCPAKTYM